MKKGVQKIYSEVAETYEWVNHVLTCGLDMRWRRKGAKAASRAGGLMWLDVCSGTGEMVSALKRHKKPGGMIVSADFSREMLAKSRSRNSGPGCSFVLSDAKRMPFPDSTFDLVTISFATRNIDSNRERLLSYLREFHRLLKPGGLFVNVETSQPSLSLLKRLFHLYIRLFVQRIGFLISGSRSGYAYLAHTIPRFYGAAELSSILLKAGFVHAPFKRLFLGIAAIHTAVKADDFCLSSGRSVS